jgi:hypothetical protein
MLQIKDAHVGLQENYNWVFYIGLECPRTMTRTTTTTTRNTEKEMVKNNRTESLNTGKDFKQHEGSRWKLVH